MKDQHRAYLLAGITILSWSTVATAFKLALSSQSAFQVLLIASITSACFLFINLIITNKLHLLANMVARDFLNSALLGLLNPFLYYLILFNAYSNLPAQVAQPLNMVWPIILVLISIPLLGQKISRRSIFAMFISFSGIILVSSQGAGKEFHTSQIPFMLLALGTSVIWAFYFILNVRDKRTESVKLFTNFSFSSLFLLIYLFLSQESFPQNPKNILLDIYIGIFEMGLSYLLWLKALRLSESTDKISNLVFIFPFISLIFIYFILGEKIHFTTIYGLTLVVSGVMIQRIRPKVKR